MEKLALAAIVLNLRKPKTVKSFISNEAFLPQICVDERYGGTQRGEKQGTQLQKQALHARACGARRCFFSSIGRPDIAALSRYDYPKRATTARLWIPGPVVRQVTTTYTHGLRAGIGCFALRLKNFFFLETDLDQLAYFSIYYVISHIC
jgi:hypothetical protein